MNRERIEGRLGPVTDMGAAELPGYKLVFDIHSSGNNCAAADIHEGTGEVFGRVYEISEEQARTLDRKEGVASGVYRRHDVIVPGFGDAITYVGTDMSRQRFCDYHSNERPSREYLGHLINGLEDPAMRAPLVYINHVIATARPSLIFERFTAEPTFDNRSDYRRSTVGMSSALRGALHVEPGDFVLARKPGVTGEQMHLVVQKLPQELLGENPSASGLLQIATLSREAREALEIEATGERRARDKFKTVYEPIDFYPVR